MAAKSFLVVDTDVGTDDAVAIVMALSQPNVDLIGVTCVHGNTSLDNVLVNTLRVLKLCQRLDIPVFKGAASPLIGSESIEDVHVFHGNDGMGGVPDPEPPRRDIIQSEHAVNALIRMANEHPGEVTLVAIGPMTNLALATKMDPEFSKKLKKLVIMGGNIEGKGNKWPGAEFNFRIDPEAVSIVLREYHCPITIVPMETCIKYGCSWDWYHKWTSTETVKGRFVRDILQHKTELKRTKLNGVTAPTIYDALAMAITIDPDVITEMCTMYVRIELIGQYTRGQMVQICRYDGTPSQPSDGAKVDVLIKFNMDKFQNLLMQTLE